jgi:hypothetical protein
MPDGLPKTLLIWAAPTVTVIVGALYLWIGRTIDAYRRDWARNREFRDARAAINEALANPHLTEQQKKDFQERLVELDEIIVELRMRSVSKGIHKK